ncbi:MAG: hypothetical protein IPL59_26805 [Candidatus Competibacteraceae bacterium]|nr:hypothetical protein [Candidatus Competibacteraceae bacterium]
MSAPTLISELGARVTRAVLLLSREVLQDHQAPRRRCSARTCCGNIPTMAKPSSHKILEAAKPYLLRVVGPDHLGYAVPSTHLNASLSCTQPLAGYIASLRQSAAVMRSVIDWATSRDIGFSHVISVAMRWDVDFGDQIDYLLRDSNTRAI